MKNEMLYIGSELSVLVSFIKLRPLTGWSSDLTKLNCSAITAIIMSVPLSVERAKPSQALAASEEQHCTDDLERN